MQSGLGGVEKVLDKIKICYFINGFVNGGVESVIYNYITHMDRKRFDIQIISWNVVKDVKAYQKFVAVGIKIYLITNWKRRFVRSWREVENILDIEKYDIIHVHVNDLNWIPLWQAFMCKIPVRISHSHMAYPMSELSIQRKILYFIERHLGGIVVTDYFACSYEALKLIVTRKKTKNVYIMRNAIEINKFLFSPQKRRLLRRQLGIEDEIVVGHIGRFENQKNHKFLIETYYEFQLKYPHSRLLLIGNGKLKPEIIKLVEEKRIENNVIFYGTTNQVADLYNVMDIMVFPSLWEGLSLVCVEAEINGLSVLASSNVSVETQISSKLMFLNLDLGSRRWAEEMIQIIDSERIESSRNSKNDFRNTGYDIEQEAKKLEQKYINLLR